MPLDTDAVDLVTFDSFSTLVDVDSTARAVEARVDDPVAFAREWHARAANYGMAANHLDAYATYYDLHRDALAYLLAARGVDVSDAEIDEMTAVYHEMEPFADVRPGMERLVEAGYDVGIVTNGDPAMLDSLVETLGVEDLLAAAVSADEVERHKPGAELYEHAADRSGVAVDRVAHVSNGQTDVMGAVHAGMQGVWLDRQGNQPEPFGPDPDLAVESVDEVVERLV